MTSFLIFLWFNRQPEHKKVPGLRTMLFGSAGTVHPELVEGGVAEPFMLRQACPLRARGSLSRRLSKLFILREPQDERLN